MAYTIKAKKDGAWVAIDHPETPVIDGARQEPIAVRKKIDGAWVDFWTNYAGECALNTRPTNTRMSYEVQSNDSLLVTWYPTNLNDATFGSVIFEFVLPDPVTELNVAFDWSLDSDITHTVNDTDYYASSRLYIYTGCERSDAEGIVYISQTNPTGWPSSTESAGSGTAEYVTTGGTATISKFYLEFFGTDVALSVGDVNATARLLIEDMVINGEKYKFPEDL